ncbi:chaperone NapD [Sulfurovum sp. bin170]|uniref:chaperone NapD n=1 Tax=Sulfurovum sp. bin170 TaxID=2695268 RepID=UPI0013DEA85B|nr:chaperone NapD [Sulfurovum sp. bin170]NEW59680.1 chaperone NapD [Sulfurovum sp. bin170]
MNISSIVVQTLPENVEKVIAIIKENSDICEYHLHDPKGKIIVTVEGKDVEEDIEKLVDIQCFDHVIAADMMMTYQEDQLDEEFKKLEAQSLVPEILTRENVDPRTVVYNGDLKKRF